MILSLLGKFKFRHYNKPNWKIKDDEYVNIHLIIKNIKQSVENAGIDIKYDIMSGNWGGDYEKLSMPSIAQKSHPKYLCQNLNSNL